MRSIKYISSFFVLGYRPLGIIRLIKSEDDKPSIILLGLPYLVKISHDMRLSLILPNYYEFDLSRIERDKPHKSVGKCNQPSIDMSVFDGLLSQLVRIAGRTIDKRGFFVSFIYAQDRNVKNKLEEELQISEGIVTAFDFPRRSVQIKFPNKRPLNTKNYGISVFFSSYKVYSELLPDITAEASKMFYEERPEGYKDLTVLLNGYPLYVPSLYIELNNSDPMIIIGNILKNAGNIIREDIENKGGRFLDLFVHALHEIRGLEIVNAIEKRFTEFEKNDRKDARRSAVRSMSVRMPLLRFVLDSGLIVDRKRLEKIFDEDTLEKFLSSGLLYPIRENMLFAAANGAVYPISEALNSDSLKPVVFLSEALHPVVYLDHEMTELPDSFKYLLRLEVKIRKAASLGYSFVAICPRTYYPYVLPDDINRLIPIELEGNVRSVLEKVNNEELLAFDPVSINSYIKGNMENVLFRDYLESIVEVLRRRGKKIEIKFVNELISDLSSSPREGIGEVDEAFILKYNNRFYLTLVEIKRKKIQSPAEALIYYTKRAAHIKDLVDRVRGEVDNVRRLRFVFAFIDALPRVPSYNSVYYSDVSRVLMTAESLSKLALREVLEIYEKDPKSVDARRYHKLKYVYIRFLDILNALFKDNEKVLDVLKEAIETYNFDGVDLIDFAGAYTLLERIKNTSKNGYRSIFSEGIGCSSHL